MSLAKSNPMVFTLCCILLISGCAAISYQPQVWKSDGNLVSVTRPAMATSTDTSKIADQYCAQFQKKAALIKLASPLSIPMRDEFICESDTD